jgi:hypothetical protein
MPLTIQRDAGTNPACVTLARGDVPRMHLEALTMRHCARSAMNGCSCAQYRDAAPRNIWTIIPYLTFLDLARGTPSMERPMPRRPEPVQQMSNAPIRGDFPGRNGLQGLLGRPALLEGRPLPSLRQCRGHGFGRFSLAMLRLRPADLLSPFPYRRYDLREHKQTAPRLKVTHLMLTRKKGMSALQIMRFMGFGSYKTEFKYNNRFSDDIFSTATGGC